MKEILNDLEIAEIQKFISNDVMKNAVKKVLLAGLYSNGTLKKGEEAPSYSKNFALGLVLSAQEFTDEHLGQVLRGQAEGIRTLELAFGHLEGMKVKETKEGNKENPAR